MNMAIAFREEYFRISFTPLSLHTTWTGRVKLFMQLLKELSISRYFKIVNPRKATLEEVLLAHTEDYIEYVKRSSEIGGGYLDYGDTRSYKGVFQDAMLAVGGTITLAEMIREGCIEVGFNPQGGFHHAKTHAASGFCVFNDVAIVALLFRKWGFRRIAIVDIDAHHGDGTQQILYNKDILKISMHMYYPGFFPGTGDIYELGEGDGYGYSVNIPLPPGSGDDIFSYSLEEVILPLLEWYKPEVIVVQMGCDGHEGDPLAMLRFTTKTYRIFSENIRNIAEKYSNRKIICLGGGGYHEDNVARSWLLMLLNFSDLESIEYVKNRLRDVKEDTKSTGELWEIVKRRIRDLKNELSTIHGIVL